MDRIKQSAKFLSLKHPDNIINFSSSYKFYHISGDRSSYVIAVCKINDVVINKIRFSLKGIVLNNVTDCLLSNNLITRKSGNYESLIKHNKILYTKFNLKLFTFPKVKKEALFISNPNIGVIDCETYFSMDGINRIYCLGFKTNFAVDPITYYINDK